MPPRTKRPPQARGAKTADRIFHRLINAIVTGEIETGVPFREAYFAQRWGVSRTPIREAVRRAAETGFLTLRRNRAPLIRSFSPAEIGSLYELRDHLERLALKLAFAHIPPQRIQQLQELAEASRHEAAADWAETCLEFDRQLHLSWSEFCQNPWLTESLGRLWNSIRILQRYMAQDRSLLRRSAAEHREIVRALVAGNRVGTARKLSRHIRLSGIAVKSAAERERPAAGLPPPGP